VCTGVGEVGVGAACGGKYQSCKCQDAYKETCTAAGQKGVGTPCEKKYYTSCCDDTCPAGYSLTNPGGSYITTTTKCGSICYTAVTDSAPSGSTTCGQWKDSNTDYWNADGAHKVDTSKKCWRGYGAYATITARGTFENVLVSFWQLGTTTVSGGNLNITSQLWIGPDGPSVGSGWSNNQGSHLGWSNIADVTFQSPVVVNGKIYFSQDPANKTSSAQHSKATFSKGLTGTYTCVAQARDWSWMQEVDCTGYVIK